MGTLDGGWSRPERAGRTAARSVVGAHASGFLTGVLVLGLLLVLVRLRGRVSSNT
ncbi:hypothetical protein [Streptomyces sp. SID12488]|uniref:hypothetical protein n=1 Tax=Streptomyces sp. SID12488 TaxID=2706040 RepID=UPI0013D9DE35|nr:hypothetical protein [Streptomyces sp. SID12488]NEA66479.1 hypothetical protein [Streptomyces sp. SID12488]